MTNASIGSELTRQREKLGLDKGQAADKIGMSRTTYSSYELDAQRPSVDVFPALAEFLDIPIEELLVLYGATSVAVVRPSLDRILANRDVPDSDLQDPQESVDVGDQDNDGDGPERIVDEWFAGRTLVSPSVENDAVIPAHDDVPIAASEEAVVEVNANHDGSVEEGPAGDDNADRHGDGDEVEDALVDSNPTHADEAPSTVSSLILVIDEARKKEQKKKKKKKRKKKK